MNLQVIDRVDFRFAASRDPDIDLRKGPEVVRAAVSKAEAHLVDPARAEDRRMWGVVAIMGHAVLGEQWQPPAPVLADLADWMKADAVGKVMFWYSLSQVFPAAIPELAARILEARPDAVVVALQAALMAPLEHQAACLRALAHNAVDAEREHFFALLGKHRRLLPPGTIKSSDFEPAALAETLRAGITDRVKGVRERAIAVAFGMNVVRLVRASVLARLDDPEMDVRQYAIVALGTLDDDETRARLVDKLERGTQPEITSAIFALARRPDGLARVLALADDQRDWVRTSLLEALAEVSAPMTDDQIAALERTAPDARLPRVIERHLGRTRRGEPEYGPDGGWFVVRHAPATQEPPTD